MQLAAPLVSRGRGGKYLPTGACAQRRHWGGGDVVQGTLPWAPRGLGGAVSVERLQSWGLFSLGKKKMAEKGALGVAETGLLGVVFSVILGGQQTPWQWGDPRQE